MRVFFHHIIKTAGISVRSYLVERLGESNVTPPLIGMPYREAMRDYAKFAAVVGHMLVQAGDKLQPDLLSIVFLRDPVERALSQFSFLHTTHAFGRTRRASSAHDIDEWLDMLSEPERHALNAQVDTTWGFGWDDLERAPSLDQKVEAAMCAIEAFEIVGLQDRFHESLGMLAARAGWPPPSTPPRINVTPNRMAQAALSDHARGRLRRYLEPDEALYRHALMLFGRQQYAAKVHLPAVAVPSDAGVATATMPPSTWARATGGGSTAPEIATAEAGRPATEREMSIAGGSVFGEISGPGVLQVGETAVIDVRFTSRVSEERLAIAFVIRDAADSMLFGISTLQLGDFVAVVPGTYVAQFRFCNHLAPGSYRVDAALHRKNATGEVEIDVRTTLIAFDVVDILTRNFSGRFHLDVETDVLATTPEARVERTPIDPGSWPLRRRNPALADFRARIEQLADIDGLPRASDTIVRVRVTNLGAEQWPAFGRRPVRVAYHWRDEHGSVVDYEGLRSMLPRDVAPGESLAVDCFLRAPDGAGDRTLVWTLLQEEVAWFDEVDRSSQCTVRIAVT